MKFRTEAWRVGKFILITGAVNLTFALLYSAATNALAASGISAAGEMLTALSYAYTILTTMIATLLNRYFTFRATEKWYIAVAVMAIAAMGWNWLAALPLAASANLGMNAALSMSSILGMLWFVVSYLLQRCVIYCHTVDTNGWFRRFHPTNDE